MKPSKEQLGVGGVVVEEVVGDDYYLKRVIIEETKIIVRLDFRDDVDNFSVDLVRQDQGNKEKFKVLHMWHVIKNDLSGGGSVANFSFNQLFLDGGVVSGQWEGNTEGISGGFDDTVNSSAFNGSIVSGSQIFEYNFSALPDITANPIQLSHIQASVPASADRERTLIMEGLLY